MVKLMMISPRDNVLSMGQVTCSVIIPAFNHAKHLERSVGSALAQTFREIEVIVVDDGSTDDTPEVMKQYVDRGVRYIRTENNGPGAAKNVGIQESSGKYLQFLDADDLILPEKIETHVAILEDDDDLDLVYCDCPMTQPDGGYIENASWPLVDKEPLDLLTIHNPIPTHSALVRRRAVVDVGLFDERRQFQEDWDLWLRLALNGSRFKYVPGVLAHYYRGKQGVTSNAELMFRRNKNLLEKHLNNQLLKDHGRRYFGVFISTLYLHLFSKACEFGWWQPAGHFIAEAVRADWRTLRPRHWLYFPEILVRSAVEKIRGRELDLPADVYVYTSQSRAGDRF
jgi:glycosyltransferase involved in cell wall biosynthesis